MYIRPFGVEIWMNEYETQCLHNLAETCVHSLKLGELLQLAGLDEAFFAQLANTKMGYGEIKGSKRLRNAIASLYDDVSPDNIVTTHGTIGANSLVHQTLVSRGDHVICIAPTYQQHYSIPESVGADVELLWLTPEHNFLPDLKKLKAMLRPDTRLVALNNPNNPTGALMDRAYLTELVDLVRPTGAWILCDEVYRGTDQHGDGYTTSMADLYEKGISTAGMSKTYSLAGLRLGWIAGPSEVIEQVMQHRDYNTISVGQLDELVSAIALENRDKVLARAHDITRGNLAALSEWLANEPLLSWVPPQSGTTALIKYDLPMSSRDFCLTVLREEGVLLTPGGVMDMEGWIRIGYANPKEDLTEGLKKISSFLASQRC